MPNLFLSLFLFGAYGKFANLAGVLGWWIFIGVGFALVIAIAVALVMLARSEKAKP